MNGTHLDKWLDETITVCAECLRACCWQGIFMCDAAQTADITKKTRRELIPLHLESTDYMIGDGEHNPVMVYLKEY